MNTWVLSVLSAEIEVSANSRIHRYWPYLTGHVERSQTSLLNRINSPALMEWTSDAIQKHVDRALSRTRSAMNDAVKGLRDIANGIARSDMPTHEEADLILRNAPRFDMFLVPEPVGAAWWRWAGRRTAHALARQSLRRGSFKDELHRYGRALSQWGEQAARRMQTLVGSYADAYRAQLNRMRGLSAEGLHRPSSKATFRCC